jgi:endo-1,4-beta-xylanase
MNKSIFFIAAAALMFSACADDNVPGFSTDEPASLLAQDSLNALAPLKEYVDTVKYPNFILGGGTSAAPFNEQGKVYAFDKANFKEVVTGNAFKYASVVKSDGTMDFSTVQAFVKNATKAGLSVYGHTLCWHSQQQVAYLNGLITDPNAAKHVLHLNIPEAKANLWDWELYVDPVKPMVSGKTYTLKLRVKASQNYHVTVWPQGASTQYWPTPAFDATTEWTNINASFEAKQDLKQLRFELGTFGGEIWMDDVQLLDPDGNNLIGEGSFEEGKMDGWSKPSWHGYTLNIVNDPDQGDEGGGITEQQKKDTLTWALNNFISGMMKACDGKVKAWDAVNEPMSDAVPSELKTGGRDGDKKTNFFWQDHLGKDYARTVIRLARKAAGDSVQLKLFINDYNLEAAYNHNAKCKGLIDMIKYWESDGVTKIDGIGSQMYVTCSMDPVVQKANEDAYVNMLKLLAATGKLVRISELDMGIQDANHQTVNTADVTPEMHKRMAEYYKFIVEKYLEIIPVAQQYGICVWAPTDSPKGSGWRADEPIGLWNGNYVRKPAYAGFAEGLQGK